MAKKNPITHTHSITHTGIRSRVLAQTHTHTLERNKNKKINKTEEKKQEVLTKTTKIH